MGQKQQEKVCIKQSPERSTSNFQQTSNFFPIQSHTGHAFSLTSNQRDMCRMPLFKEAFFESQGPRLLWKVGLIDTFCCVTGHDNWNSGPQQWNQVHILSHDVWAEQYEHASISKSICFLCTLQKHPSLT